MSIFGKKKEVIKIIEKAYFNGKWVSRSDDNIIDIKGVCTRFCWYVTVLYKDGTIQDVVLTDSSKIIYRRIEI